jgi:hypothetical protein
MVWRYSGNAFEALRSAGGAIVIVERIIRAISSLCDHGHKLELSARGTFVVKFSLFTLPLSFQEQELLVHRR